MKISSSSLICLILTLTLLSAGAKAATPEEPLWPTIKSSYFGDREIRQNASDLLVLDAPKRAEDAAIVPITVKSLVPQTPDKYIKNLHIIIDNNPDPYSANFHLSSKLDTVEISTRMRVDQYTDVRAIAEMNDGTLHMVSKFVKASGGCSAPAGKDAEAALARMGKMQIRMRNAQEGMPVTAQVVVSHPQYNGLQFDQKSRKYIPAHYINKIELSYAGEPLIAMDAGISVSEDPSIRFTFTPEASGTFEAKAFDTEENSYNIQKEI